jgi:competence protein ComEC
MMSLFVVALCVERETDPINTLLMSAFILLAIHPPTIFDVSFQLSFLALWGIVVLVPPVMAYATCIKHNWQRSLMQFVVVSCAASCATAIPALFIFNQTSLNGILANFLIVPLLGYGAVLVGFCALPFVYLYPPMAHLLMVSASWIVEISNRLIGYFAHLPVLKFYGITALDMFLFISGLSLLTFVKYRPAKTILMLALPLIAMAVHMHTSVKADGNLHITMLIVGQAESLFLRMPDGATMLVDGGGYLHDTGRDFGERVPAPALHRLGADRIDYMLLTHAHPDHLGGLLYVARTMPVGNFYESVAGGAGDEYQRLCSALKQNKVPFHTLKAGDRLNLSGGVSLKVLSPYTGGQSTDSSDTEMGLNEESLVFRLEYGSFSMLFSADAGFPAEARMLSEGAVLKAIALKVGHHGSRFSTSDEFLNSVNPEIAFISAGYGNTFRLPSPQTLAQLERRHIKIFRTDRDGTLELVTNGREWSVTAPYRRE